MKANRENHENVQFDSISIRIDRRLSTCILEIYSLTVSIILSKRSSRTVERKDLERRYDIADKEARGTDRAKYIQQFLDYGIRAQWLRMYIPSPSRRIAFEIPAFPPCLLALSGFSRARSLHIRNQSMVRF